MKACKALFVVPAITLLALSTSVSAATISLTEPAAGEYSVTSLGLAADPANAAFTPGLLVLLEYDNLTNSEMQIQSNWSDAISFESLAAGDPDPLNPGSRLADSTNFAFFYSDPLPAITLPTNIVYILESATEAFTPWIPHSGQPGFNGPPGASITSTDYKIYSDPREGTEVPEPGTVLLLAGGAFAAFGFARKRKKVA